MLCRLSNYTKQMNSGEMISETNKQTNKPKLSKQGKN